MALMSGRMAMLRLNKVLQKRRHDTPFQQQHTLYSLALAARRYYGHVSGFWERWRFIINAVSRKDIAHTYWDLLHHHFAGQLRAPPPPVPKWQGARYDGYLRYFDDGGAQPSLAPSPSCVQSIARDNYAALAPIEFLTTAIEERPSIGWLNDSRGMKLHLKFYSLFARYW